MNDTQKIVIAIVVEHLNLDPDEVFPETSFVKDLGADSLDSVELVIVFEQRFEIEIEDEVVKKLKTVQDVTDYIVARQ